MKKMGLRYVWNRRKRLNKEKEASLEIQITYEKKAYYFSTRLNLKKTAWDDRNQQIKNHPNQVELNKLLLNVRKKITDYYIECRNNGIDFSIEKAKRLLDHTHSDNFLDFVHRETENDQSRRQTSQNTLRSFLNILRDFGGVNFFSDINYQNIVKFNNYLIHTRKLGEHSLHKRHQQFQYFMRRAENLDKFDPQKNPYRKFKPKRPGKAVRKYLTSEELKNIEAAEPASDRMQKIKDLFIFCCYTGLSFSDVKVLCAKNITRENGRVFIEMKRKKTDTYFYIPLLPKAQAIFEKYNGELPVLTNQKYNSYLKELQVISHVEKTLTSHVARHTFATTVTLANGVSLEAVSEMLGHTDLSTTKIYAKMLKERVASEMEKLK